MSAVTQITKLVSNRWVATGLDLNWQDVERHFGRAFPDDYKAIVSHFGLGTFLPCEVSLCDYLDAVVSQVDEFALGATRNLTDDDDGWIRYCPGEPARMLPLMQFRDDHFFFLRNDGQIVWYRGGGLQIEMVPQESSSNLLLRLLHAQTSFDSSALRACLHGKDASLGPGDITFVSRQHTPKISPDACRMVAIGGGTASYLLGCSAVIQVSRELELQRATIIEPELIDVAWGTGVSDRGIAPRCMLFVSLDKSHATEESQSRQMGEWLARQCQEQLTSSERKVVIANGRETPWVLVPDYGAGMPPDSIKMFAVALVGNMVIRYELHCVAPLRDIAVSWFADVIGTSSICST